MQKKEAFHLISSNENFDYIKNYKNKQTYQIYNSGEFFKYQRSKDDEINDILH